MSRFRLNFVDRSETRVQSMDIDAASVGSVLEVAQRTEGFTAVEIFEEGQSLARLVRAGPDGTGLWHVIPQNPRSAR